MLKLNAILKVKNVDFHSKEITERFLNSYRSIYISFQRNIYFITVYKTEINLKLN